MTYNLNQAGRNSIYSCKNTSNIIIKEADKESAVFVMNGTDYEQEAARQLTNTTFYRPLPSDPTEEYQKKLHHLLMKLPSRT